MQDHFYCSNCSNTEEGVLIYHPPIGGNCVIATPDAGPYLGLDGYNPQYLEDRKSKMKYCPYCGEILPSEELC